MHDKSSIRSIILDVTIALPLDFKSAGTICYTGAKAGAEEGEIVDELIERVSAATGLDGARAEKAVGIVLSLIRKEGDGQKVDELFARLPGADELAARHQDAKSGGGLLGLFGGVVGGPLAAVGKLQAAGLSMEEINALGRELLGYAREKAGEPLVNEVAASIPGLSRYL